MTTARKAPWKKTNPRRQGGKSPRKLTAAQKASAKRRATGAGRPYPNLVDNMRAASKANRTRAKKRK